MSIKNRVLAAAVATSLVAGTASFALAEPRQSRRATIEEGQGFVGQLFEWVRELVSQRRPEGRNAAADRAPQRKCGTFPDPNGLCK